MAFSLNEAVGKHIPQPIKDVYNEYKQPIRGFLGWSGGLVIQIVTQNGGWSATQTWDWPRWRNALVAAAIPGVVAYMRGGDKNHSPEELYDLVHAEKMKRAEEGMEITDPNGLPLKKPAP